MKVLVELHLEVDVPEDSPLDCEALMKNWLWAERKDEILRSLRVSRIGSCDAAPTVLESLQSYDTAKKLLLLDSISRAQRQYLLMQEAPAVFGGLLLSMLDLMNAEYGFIGEVKYETDGTMYLQSHAITNIAWNDETRELYERNSATGLRFHKFDNLFGAVLTSKKVVISNIPRKDPRAGGIPKGHPPLNAFLGVPLFDQGFSDLIGMIGIANKPGGYVQDDVDFIEPFVVTCSNLIQAYNIAQENKRLINTLEEKVAERTQELSLANERLETANKRVVAASAAQLTHFACMSHEIRTPLNCIIGLSSLLQEMSLSEKQREAISMIVTSGELLCAVVNDILDFAKLESGNVLIEIRPISLQGTLDSVVNSIGCKAQHKLIGFETTYTRRLPEHIETDGNRLQQILYNLLGNALKFSDTGGLVELFVDYVPHESPFESTRIVNEPVPSRCPFQFDKPRTALPSSDLPSGSRIGTGVLRFSVKDYGRGIDPNDYCRIFEPFGQANRDTEKLYGGTGLGLAITSRLVERMGGRIAVESELEKWTKFTVDLPISAVSECDQSKCFADACMLYVDHPNKTNHRVVSSLGFPFEHFTSCQEMLDWLVGESKSEGGAQRFLVCLIHEDFCSPDILRKISREIELTVVTFGPTRDRIAESHMHVRSLSSQIPAVLLKSIADVRRSMVESRCIRPKPSFAAPIDILKEVEVLIAEDNVVNQKVLCRMLQRSGVEHIDLAQNGQEAVDKSASKYYDLIFMDMQMPIMCGDEACRIILDSYKGQPRRPKIAFVSAHVSTTFETQAIDAGADGFLSKPFNVKKFEDFIRSLNIREVASSVQHTQ